MFKKALLLLALVLGACSQPQEAVADAAIPKANPPTLNLNYVIKIQCTDTTKDKSGVGTAFYIGNGQFITAAHVANFNTVCIDPYSGLDMPVTKVDEKHDISLIQMPTVLTPWAEKGMQIDCGGFDKDEFYYSIGWAAGQALLVNKLTPVKGYTDEEFTADNTKRPGMKIFDGLLIQGMSGGPVTNTDGKVVGINNVTGYFYTSAYSYELKNTFLCKGKK